MLPRDLSPASFRGVRFLVPHDTAEFGRNSIRHATPDSSFHYLEDNGAHPPEFKITAILHGQGLTGQFRALRAALSRPGPGLLKHPYWGNQFCMVDGKARIKRDDKDAGVLELEINFSVTGPPALPGAVSGVAAFVTGLVTSALSSLFDLFSASYGNPISGNSITAVGAGLSLIGEAIDNRFASAGTGGADLIRRDTELAVDAGKLGTALSASVGQARDEPGLYSASKIVTGFSAVADVAAAVADGAALIGTGTLDLVRRRECLALIGATMEAAAFAVMAEGMASRDYDTADDVDRDEETLTDLIDRIQGRELPAAVHTAMLDIFTATSEVLAGVAVRRPRVVEIDTYPVPVSILAYELYESDANEQKIVTLNLSQPPILMADTVSVLMEQI